VNLFYVVNGKKLKQYFILLLAAIFVAGIIYAERSNITVFQQVSNQPAAIYSVDTDRKVLALTFDISWGDTRMDPILEVLNEKNVTKATFFLNAQWAREHPEIAKKIADSGFEIGSHGLEHKNYSELSDEEIRKQITAAHQILSEVTGKTPSLIRFPNGDIDKRVLAVADSLGYRTIQWDTDPKDWENPGVDRIIGTVVSRAHPGDIILLHASDSSKQTHQALPTIIDKLRSQGYGFATVSELINDTDVQGDRAQEQQKSN